MCKSASFSLLFFNFITVFNLAKGPTLHYPIEMYHFVRHCSYEVQSLWIINVTFERSTLGIVKHLGNLMVIIIVCLLLLTKVFKRFRIQYVGN